MEVVLGAGVVDVDVVAIVVVCFELLCGSEEAAVSLTAPLMTLCNTQPLAMVCRILNYLYWQAVMV